MKHVLITGGSDGLGKAAARKLLAAGFQVTILSHNENKTRDAARTIGCKYVVADVGDARQVMAAFESAVQQNGEIDVLLNCAGYWILGPLEANSPEDVEKAIAVNALGTIYCTQAVVGSMKRRKSGRIINVISQAGLDARAERSVYNSSKWAVTGFTKCLQAELKPFKISVVGLYPGAMQTGFFSKAGDMKVRVGMLDPDVVAEEIARICQLPDNVNIPEFGIESLDY